MDPSKGSVERPETWRIEVILPPVGPIADRIAEAREGRSSRNRRGCGHSRSSFIPATSSSAAAPPRVAAAVAEITRRHPQRGRRLHLSKEDDPRGTKWLASSSRAASGVRALHGQPERRAGARLREPSGAFSGGGSVGQGGSPDRSAGSDGLGGTRRDGRRGTVDRARRRDSSRRGRPSALARWSARSARASELRELGRGGPEASHSQASRREREWHVATKSCISSYWERNMSVRYETSGPVGAHFALAPRAQERRRSRDGRGALGRVSSLRERSDDPSSGAQRGTRTRFARAPISRQ